MRWANKRPVTWVPGCHTEMTSQPGGCLPWGTPAHPDEHVLESKSEGEPFLAAAVLLLGPYWFVERL